MRQSSPTRSPNPFLLTVVRAAAVPVLLLTLPHLAEAVEINWVDVPEYTPFSVMQGVNADGAPTWTVPTLPYEPYSQAYRLRGVVLHDPGLMLNATANYLEGPLWAMGAEWQVFVQAVALPNDSTLHSELVGDFGGAALYMAQNYGNHAWHYPDYSYSYTNAQWDAEMLRLGFPIDARTGLAVTEPLRKGDLIEVRARGGLHYRGKFNCNEQHDNHPDFDFEIVILERDVPVTPAAITLDDVMDASGAFLFDQTRQTGAEYYQAQYVTLEGVTIADASQWSSYGRVTVTDGTRQFLVRLGYNDAFDAASLPSGELSITGIFDHDAPIYQMWATSPADFAPAAPLIPGDANGDGVVNDQDVVRLADAWGRAAHASWFDGDFNRDGCVDALDAAILAAHWGQSIAETTAAAVPEPNAFLAILLGIVASVLKRRRHG